MGSISKMACDQLAQRFEKDGITGRDLFICLPYDDGQIFTSEKHPPFTVDVLTSYNPHHHRANLEHWVKRKVRQHPHIRKYFLEKNILLKSDWALLNWANLSRLSTFERTLVQVYHAVYRRDRRRNPRSRTDGKCPDPTAEQLQEMLILLQQQAISVDSANQLLQQLRQIATQIRKQDLFQQRGYPVVSLDSELEDGRSFEVKDERSPDELEDIIFEQDFQIFCQQWNLDLETVLLDCLDQGIQEGIQQRIEFWKNRKRRSHLAGKIKIALEMIYCHEMTLAQIAVELKLGTQPQVSQMLELKRFIEVTIRGCTLTALLQRILGEAIRCGVRSDPSDPEYLDGLIQQLEIWVDQRIFNQAVAEISNGRSRQKQSVFAKHLRDYLVNGKERAL